ncbi:MAG: YbaK/EbsC family protein [Deltaproteobacteria bacterium]
MATPRRGEREVRAVLEAHGIDGEIRTFGESTHNAALAARELGVELGQIANTILLRVDGDPVVVVISGDRRIDFRKVKALRGGKKVRMAGPDEVVAHTGFAVGAVSPVALPEGLPVYLDRSLRRYESIYPAAGETNNMFRTTPDDLLRLSGATEADLAR